MIEGCPLSMEIDTVASVSVVSEKFRKQLLAHMQLNPTSKKFRSYSGDMLKVLDELDPYITYKKQQAGLCLVVISRKTQIILVCYIFHTSYNR